MAFDKETTTRAEHLAWCKTRALEYVDLLQLQQAFQSMVSDLGKHSETRGHPAIGLGVDLLLSGHLKMPHEMRKFIEDLN